MPNLGVKLVPVGEEAEIEDQGGPVLGGAATVTNAAGAFTFLGVAQGAYRLHAYWIPDRSAIDAGASVLWAAQSANITAEVVKQYDSAHPVKKAGVGGPQKTQASQ